jgi:hypothetical protein
VTLVTAPGRLLGKIAPTDRQRVAEGSRYHAPLPEAPGDVVCAMSVVAWHHWSRADEIIAMGRRHGTAAALAVV